MLGGEALTTLSVAPNGDLSPKGCLLREAPTGGPCASVAMLESPQQEVLAHDGRNLLVVTDEDNLISFARDATGALTVQQCFRSSNDDELDPDDPAAGCKVASWDELGAVAVSADGRAVFVGGDLVAGAYRRDPATGALTEVGCLSSEISGCGPLQALSFPTAMAASADGRNLYATNADGGLDVLQLTVAITSATARGSAVRVGLACPPARREGCAGRLTGARAAHFRLAGGRSRAVTVRLTVRQRAGLRRRGRVAIALSARVRGVEATTRRVTVRAKPAAHAAKRARP